MDSAEKTARAVDLSTPAPYYTPAQDTITLSSINNAYNSTVIGGGYTYANANTTITNNGAITGMTTPWTATTGTTSWSNTVSPKINLDGEGADIVVNGVSLMDLLKDRLNIMIPNPKLEKEWDELKALGDQYRALEAKLKEQGEMWAKLKAMPPPDLT